MKITKSQLRQIIKEEVMKEFGGAYGGRAHTDQSKPGHWDAKNKAHRAAVSKKMRPEDIEGVINKEMTKVFPDLTSLRHISPTDRKGIVNIATQGSFGDPDTVQRNAAEFFAGKSTHNQAKTFLDRLKRYK